MVEAQGPSAKHHHRLIWSILREDPVVVSTRRFDACYTTVAIIDYQLELRAEITVFRHTEEQLIECLVSE